MSPSANIAIRHILIQLHLAMHRLSTEFICSCSKLSGATVSEGREVGIAQQSLIDIFVKGSIIIRDVCISNAYSFQNV